MSNNYNEFHIRYASYLKSYDSIVAKYDHKEECLILGKRWDFSKTTIRHIGIFMDNMGMKPIRGKKGILKAIEDDIILIDPRLV